MAIVSGLPCALMCAIFGELCRKSGSGAFDLQWLMPSMHATPGCFQQAITVWFIRTKCEVHTSAQFFGIKEKALLRRKTVYLAALPACLSDLSAFSTSSAVSRHTSHKHYAQKVSDESLQLGKRQSLVR